ncbi:MAG: nucleotidyltransferase family protein [Hominisplanchenecus sp.]
MKIKMIYLAAGNSRRFGNNKLYHKIAGRPMFLYGLDVLEQVLKETENTVLTVVTVYEEIRKEVLTRKNIWKDRMEVVDSPDSEKGISCSIRAGLTGTAADYYLFCVADQPWIQTETILELIRETTEKHCPGGWVQWNDISGNPTIFSKELLPQLLVLDGDTGGKSILRKQKNICVVQAKQAAEIKDIDVPFGSVEG